MNPLTDKMKGKMILTDEDDSILILDEDQDNLTTEPDLLYGPELKGAALPNNGYDKNKQHYTFGSTKVMFAPALLHSHYSLSTGLQTTHMASSISALQSPKPAVEIQEVDDLSEVYMRDIGINHHTFATYPPIPSTVNTMSRGPGTQHTPLRQIISTDAVISTTMQQTIDKENFSPNRQPKRQTKSTLVRKFLKRCRGIQHTESNPTLSTGQESNQNISNSVIDQSGLTTVQSQLRFSKSTNNLIMSRGRHGLDLKRCGLKKMKQQKSLRRTGTHIVQQRKITKMQKDIAALNNSVTRTQQTMADLKKSESILDDLLSQEELYWQQRSRVDWMQIGDQNTKFFHAHATSRKRNNTIKSRTNSAGITHSSKKEMTTIITSYFQELFTASTIDTSSLQHTIGTIPTTATAAMNSQLTKPFTPEEISQSLKTMNPDKSPGSDGMSAMFYQQYWEIVGPSVTDVILGVLNHGRDMDLINTSIITLIPKITSPAGMGDYRPISLCNVIYKLISKVLVLRFKDVLPFVISETQSSFLSNRLITDNILIAFEYIEAVMVKMGFDTHWIALIMKCLSSTSFSFSLNGEIIGNVTPSRGLRQGDPLSPYLFFICPEGLSRLLNHEESLGNLQGFRLTRQAPPVTHLLFVDDSLLFCHASNSSALAIQRVLHIYNRASSQLLNTSKSVMSFSPSTPTITQQFFHASLNMPISKCHERYLGLPAYSGRDKSELFSSIKERIWKLLNTWKEKLFSIGGIEVLLKALLAKQAWRIFEMPNSLLSRLLKLRYFSNTTFLESNIGHSPSLTWQGICWGRDCCSKDFDTKWGMESASTSHKDLWKLFWNLKLPSKIKIFAWRVIQNFLPVAAALYKKKVLTSAACSLCSQARESIGHALFQCKHAKAVWRHFNYPIDFNKAQNMVGGDYIFHLATLLSQQELELVFVIMWVIWTDRNKINHGESRRDGMALANYATNYMENYHKANNRPTAVTEPVTPAQISTLPTEGIPWKPPDMYGLKLNVDAAVNPTSKVLGVGAIVRNYKGEVMAAMSKLVQGCFRSDEMEAKALFHALNWISQLPLSVTLVETDALRVSNFLNHETWDLSCFSDIIFDVRCLLSSFSRIVISHVKRSANQAAHGLAKHALGLDVDTCWMGEIPYPIFSVVKDCGF
uniref:Reverse transcriptase domain-containing protein n=1 Tax=Cannabis sativa TaxID=3483 RepID=A0A803PE40_CANSA